jgi:hypothetical protein
VKGLIISHSATYLILGGILTGFSISWYKKIQRPVYLDLLMDTLSVSLVIWFLVELFSSEFNFFDLLRTFVRLLVGLQLFHSFTLHSEKDYAFNQAITIPLVVSSIVLSRENPKPYLNYYIITYLFLWIIILSFSVLERKRRLSQEVIDVSTSGYRILRDASSSIFLFLVIILSSWSLFISIPRMERPSFGIIPSSIGPAVKEKPKSKTKFPFIGLARPRPESGVLLKAGKIPETLKGKGPGPGEEIVVNREVYSKELDGQGRLIRYSEKGRLDEKDYQMTRFDIAYDQQDRVIAYSEIGTYDSKPYELKRDNIIYDVQGQVIGYHEKGVYNGEEYEFTKSPPPEVKLTEAPITKIIEEPIIEKPELKRKKMPPKEIRPKNLIYLFLKYLIYLLLLLTVLFVFYLFFLYIRHKINQRRLRILIFKNPALFIIKIYKSISDILKLYGCRRLNWMVPEEYLLTISEKWTGVIDNFKLLTEKFLEAKYSFHTLNIESSFLAVKSYEKILKELKGYGNRWQNSLAHFVKFNSDIQLMSSFGLHKLCRH